MILTELIDRVKAALAPNRRERRPDSPDCWLETEVTYSGGGTATFSCPKCAVAGMATAVFDQQGHCLIELDADDISEAGGRDSECSETLGFDCLSGVCHHVEIRTASGVFLTQGKVVLAGGSVGDGLHLKFAALRSEFRRDGSLPAMYWALPLLNFVSGARQGEPSLDSHPLRVCRESERRKGRGRLPAWAPQGRLILFEFEGEPAFIERLPDYEKRTHDLAAGLARAAVTSVMAGRIPATHRSGRDVESWFPTDLVLILGLASGIEVGAPWIELRDAQGGLVSRVHLSLGSPSYARGHGALREDMFASTGRFLNSAQHSSWYGDPHYRAILKYTIRSSSYALTPGERYRNVFLALEGLAKKAGTRRVVSLAPENEQKVRGILKPARRSINQLAREADKQSDEDAPALERIAEQVMGAKTLYTSFGEYITALFRLHGLSDEAVMDAYYSEHPGPKGEKTWRKVVANLRNTVMHLGFFDFDELSELDAILISMNHLRDVLLRMVLGGMAYDAAYHVAVGATVRLQQLDWVTPATSPAELGFPETE